VAEANTQISWWVRDGTIYRMPGQGVCNAALSGKQVSESVVSPEETTAEEEADQDLERRNLLPALLGRRGGRLTRLLPSLAWVETEGCAHDMLACIPARNQHQVQDETGDS
jgi:hypothetical protein